MQKTQSQPDNGEAKSSQYPPKRQVNKPLLVVLTLLVSFTVIGVYLTFPFFRLLRTLGIGPRALLTVALSKQLPLKSFQSRINVLLLGIGGVTHEGGDLTDSMTVASFSLTKDDLALISLPRDIWSETLKDKINTAYHYGEEKKKDGGLLLSKSITEEVVGIPIHYAVMIDFAGFTRIIDLLGGVDVLIDHPFTDPTFPIAGKEKDPCGGDPKFACRYETIQFSQGWTHMDGITALNYVRSRYAEGSEGNDFARARRQQEILQALKNKVMKERIYLQPQTVEQVLTVIKDSLTTDISPTEFLALGKAASTIDKQEVRHIALAEGGNNGDLHGFFINPPLSPKYKNLWVLAPKDNSYAPLQSYIDCKLNNPTCQLSLPK